MDDERYSDEEAHEILRRAIERQHTQGDGLGHADIVAAAGEIGIPALAVNTAAQELSFDREVSQRIDTRKHARTRRFYRSLANFAVGAGFLAAIDWITSGGTWFYWPVLGWGFWVSLRGLRVVLPNHAREERLARQYVARERKKRQAAARRREASRRREHAAVGFERAVEEGVTKLLQTATRHVNEWHDALTGPPRGDSHIGNNSPRASEAPEVRSTAPDRSSVPQARVEPTPGDRPTENDENTRKTRHRVI